MTRIRSPTVLMSLHLLPWLLRNLVTNETISKEAYKWQKQTTDTKRN